MEEDEKLFLDYKVRESFKSQLGIRIYINGN